jgi:hypothetical protein
VFRLTMGNKDANGEVRCEITCPTCGIKRNNKVKDNHFYAAFGSKCSTCGAKLPLIFSLIKWQDARLRYHNTEN